MAETTVSNRSQASGAPAPHRAERGISPSAARSLARFFIERREASIFVVGVLLAIYFIIRSSHFMSFNNRVTLSQDIAPIAAIAAAECLVLCLGEIDLSAGQVFYLTPWVTHWCVGAGVPLLLAILISLAGAAAVGAINGILRTRLGLPSFVVTMGTLFAMQGIILIYSHTEQSAMPNHGTLTNLLGIWSWSEIIWAILIVAVVYLLLTRTRFGVHIIATGGNNVAAAEAGVPVARVRVWCFMICSVVAGLAGVIDAVRLTTIDPAADGTIYMFYAVAAAVIGGTALAGGRATVIGALIGAAVLGILEDGFELTGVSAQAYTLLLGIAIVVAMVVNVQLGKFALRRRMGRPDAAGASIPVLTASEGKDHP